jgi:hypothetical protein
MSSLTSGTESGQAKLTFELLESRLRAIVRAQTEVLQHYDFGWADGALTRSGESLTRLVAPLHHAMRRGLSVQQALGGIGNLSGKSQDDSAPLNQSVTHAVGALFTLGRLRHGIRPADLENLLLAKLLYQLLAEMLDDVVDSANYSVELAGTVFRLALADLGEEQLSEASVRGAFQALCPSVPAPFVASIACLSAGLTDLLRRAPRWAEFHARFRQGNERVIAGQSLSMLFNDASRDPAALEEAAREFAAPDPSVRWYERLATHMGHVSNLALLDLIFARPSVDLGDVEEHERTWYYYNLVISMLDHLLDLETDSRLGITNLALIAMHPEEAARGESARRSFRALRQADYDTFVTRLARLVAIGSRHGERSGLGSREYYRMLNATIPLVMFASCKDRNQDLLGAILRSFAAATRESNQERAECSQEAAPDSFLRAPQLTTYSQWSSRFRTQRVFTTVPRAPLAWRTPS